MSDPEDGAGRDGPSDDPAEEDPFLYPADDDGDEGGDAFDAAPSDDSGTDAKTTGPSTPDDPATEPRRDDTSRAGTSRDDAPRTEQSDEPPGRDRHAESRQSGGWLRGFLAADSGAAVYVRDVLTSVAAVLLVGVLLFAISGIWPPMVAVESGSMEPNMNVGDLVFVVDNERFVPEDAVVHDNESTGVIPADRAARIGHTEFGEHGDVIVFMPDGSERQTPVIHRAMLFVEAGENWYDRADQTAVGSASDCEELDYCPAPHAGFITKGDNERSNTNYDQVSGLSEPVRPDWVVGTAEVKIPYLGHVRLMFAGQVAVPLDTATAPRTSAAATVGPEDTAMNRTVPGGGTVRPVA